MDDDLLSAFHDAEFTDIWYAHPGPRPYAWYQDRELAKRFGGRWFAGVFTGPQHDLICVKQCETNEEAERFLSPPGWSPQEAIQLALEKRRAMLSK